MIDIQKQIACWRDGASEDLEAAHDLIAAKRVRHGLFFVHLALEKALKAHVCKQTNQLAPRIHDLLRLAVLAKLDISQEQKDFLSKVTFYNMQGRYPDVVFPIPSLERAKQYLERAKEMTEWLIKRL